MANLATRAGVEGQKLRIHTPLMDLSKADIIRRGQALGVDYRMTVSCYQANEHGEACGRCDSCRLRRLGFEQAGVPDQTRYSGGIRHLVPASSGYILSFIADSACFFSLYL